MVKKNKQNLSRVENSLGDGGYSGENFAAAIKEILTSKVEVVKNLSSIFQLTPKFWKETYEAGVAPPIKSESTHEKALNYISKSTGSRQL